MSFQVVLANVFVVYFNLECRLTKCEDWSEWIASVMTVLPCFLFEKPSLSISRVKSASCALLYAQHVICKINGTDLLTKIAEESSTRYYIKSDSFLRQGYLFPQLEAHSPKPCVICCSAVIVICA